MVKLKLTGTSKDLRWFCRILTRDRRYRVKRFSELFPNSRDKRYCRMYVDLERKPKAWGLQSALKKWVEDCVCKMLISGLLSV